MTVKLPHLTISWPKCDEELSVNVRDGVFPKGTGVVVGSSGFRPEPIVRQTAQRAVCVIGAPVINDRVSRTQVAEYGLAAADPKTFSVNLNGQFLLLWLDKRERSLSVISDRFNGVPLYWADAGKEFLASFLYYDLFKILRWKPGVQLKQESMLQFLWFSRVLMDDTYDSMSHFLMPATILEISYGGVTQSRYWRPDFSKNTKRSVQTAGEEYVAHLRRSVARLTREDTVRRYGHFLSGGHDSRSILAAFAEPPECFTVAFSDNLEVDCARQAAAIAEAPHHFIQLSHDHMVRHFDDSVRLCGGLYSFLDALFIGLEHEIQANADVVLHGHGLDYLFQGMYLPAQLIHVFGRPTFFRRLTPLGSNVVDRFLFEIPFRTKGVDIMSLIRAEVQSDVMMGLRSAVSRVLTDGDDVCATNYDRWDYLVIHALGRHYSYPNIASKLTCAEQRTPCFDNDLFDFYLSLHPKQRVGGEMMRYALNSMDHRFGKIPTGNWGMPAGASPAFKTAWLIGRKILRHVTGNSNLRAPSPSDRTWPDRETYLRNHPRLIEEARCALESTELADTLTIFNWPLLRAKGERWLAGESGGAAFLMALATLNRFLKLTR